MIQGGSSRPGLRGVVLPGADLDETMRPRIRVGPCATVWLGRPVLRASGFGPSDHGPFANATRQARLPIVSHLTAGRPKRVCSNHWSVSRGPTTSPTTISAGG